MTRHAGGLSWSRRCHSSPLARMIANPISYMILKGLDESYKNHVGFAIIRASGEEWQPPTSSHVRATVWSSERERVKHMSLRLRGGSKPIRKTSAQVKWQSRNAETSRSSGDEVQVAGPVHLHAATAIPVPLHYFRTPHHRYTPSNAQVRLHLASTTRRLAPLALRSARSPALASCFVPDAAQGAHSHTQPYVAHAAALPCPVTGQRALGAQHMHARHIASLRMAYQWHRLPLRARAPEQHSGTPSRGISTHAGFEPWEAV